MTQDPDGEFESHWPQRVQLSCGQRYRQLYTIVIPMQPPLCLAWV